METARVHHTARRLGSVGRSPRARSRPSGCGASASSCPATADETEFQSPGRRPFCRGCRNWVGAIGRNVRIDTRWATGDAERIRKHAAEWPRSRRTSSWPLAATAVGPLLQATRTVPIVFPIVGDPVGAGFVDSLARPGGNATGFIESEYSMGGKWLELLKQTAPSVTRAAVLRDTTQSRRERPVCRRPDRGAVARGGVQPDQHARRRGD